MLAHQTNALVQDVVLTEEQPPITVKGFLRPIITYKIVGTDDELVEEGRVVLQEREGLSRDSPDGSSQSPIIVAQGSSDRESGPGLSR